MLAVSARFDAEHRVPGCYAGQVVLWRPGAHPVEEDPDLGFPAFQVSAQDRRLLHVGELSIGQRAAPTAKDGPNQKRPNKLTQQRLRFFRRQWSRWRTELTSLMGWHLGPAERGWYPLTAELAKAARLELLPAPTGAGFVTAGLPPAPALASLFGFQL